MTSYLLPITLAYLCNYRLWHDEWYLRIPHFVRLLEPAPNLLSVVTLQSDFRLG